MHLACGQRAENSRSTYHFFQRWRRNGVQLKQEGLGLDLQEKILQSQSLGTYHQVHFGVPFLGPYKRQQMVLHGMELRGGQIEAP